MRTLGIILGVIILLAIASIPVALAIYIWQTLVL